ncbi:hypothetical protein WDK74_22275 [Escherichia coli]
MKTFTDIKAAASKLLAQFQTGNVDKDTLYIKGTELTVQFNELAGSFADAGSEPDAEDAAAFLELIRDFATS